MATITVTHTPRLTDLIFVYILPPPLPSSFPLPSSSPSPFLLSSSLPLSLPPPHSQL